MIWLYWNHETDLFVPRQKMMLHIAPASCFVDKLSECPYMDYLSTDFIYRIVFMSQFNNPILRQNPDINPYRHASYEVWNRLRWDFNPESRRSRRILKNLKDKYNGQKSVIVCNGPSLLKSDLSLLKNIFTFGLNKINLLFDGSDFRPSCIVVVNPFVIEQNSEFYNNTDIPIFVDTCGSKLIKSSSNVTFLHSSSQYKFAQDCSISVFPGYTVTFVAMQLAFHLGFQEVALIGCDHNFATKGPANTVVVSGEKDDNHFAPNYFAGGVKWQLPDLAASEAAYSLAYEVYSAHGRKLVNATEGGKLEVLPRVSLEKFLNGNYTTI